MKAEPRRSRSCDTGHQPGCHCARPIRGSCAQFLRQCCETELAFYVGCVNLHEQLRRKGEPTCFPLPVAADEHRLGFGGLYDVCLTLSMNRRVVGNDAECRQERPCDHHGRQHGRQIDIPSQRRLGSIDDAVRDVRSGRVLLFQRLRRSIHALQAGRRTRMESGKFDEELSRMSEIVDHIASHSMILFNESFAATNEREGSEIARQIISALLEERVKVVCVTHMYELAHGFHETEQWKRLVPAGRTAGRRRPNLQIGRRRAAADELSARISTIIFLLSERILPIAATRRHMQVLRDRAIAGLQRNPLHSWSERSHLTRKQRHGSNLW